MKKISADLNRKLKKIKLFALDFDGVFTDAKVYLNQDGIETVVCSRRDSLGMNLLKKEGIKFVVISMESSPVVAKRCEKLKIEMLYSPDDKLSSFKSLIKRERMNIEEVAYMGDDLNDLDCLKYAGVAFTVKDGASECLKIADYATKRQGGDHALREVCDLILGARKV
ncbi:MAG: HAD hydrolase family protein [Patescibacteria group bacterium]